MQTTVRNRASRSTNGVASGPMDIGGLPMAAASVLARGAQRARGTAPVAPAPTLSEDVEDVLATLTPRERRVLQLRFGFVDCRERTVEEVGKRLGVPRERITSIEAEALDKLQKLQLGADELPAPG